MNIANFYNKFHKQTMVQHKVIGEKNFTYRIILRFVNKILVGRRNLKVLDYGCGAGTIALYIANKGHSVVGVDVSSLAIRAARKSARSVGLSGVTFFELSEFENNHNDLRFDLIVCTEVIEHVRDDKKLLGGLYSKLTRNGALLLSTPSKNAPLYKLGISRSFDEKVGHLRRYDPSYLTRMIKSCGFKIKEVVKTEGVVRNSLFLLPQMGVFIKFIRGAISDLISLVDELSLILGESDIFIVATK